LQNGAIENVALTYDWLILMKKKVLESIECRFDYVEKCDLLLASTFLDFRYKTLEFIEDEEERVEKLERTRSFIVDYYNSEINPTNAR